MSQEKHAPDLIRGGHRFSEQDMRPHKNPEHRPIRLNRAVF